MMWILKMISGKKYSFAFSFDDLELDWGIEFNYVMFQGRIPDV